jgi:hypothetical protein
MLSSELRRQTEEYESNFKLSDDEQDGIPIYTWIWYAYTVGGKWDVGESVWGRLLRATVLRTKRRLDMPNEDKASIST